MAHCLIALGANLGNRAHTLSNAARALASLPGVSQMVQSHWYETAPVGGPAGQPSFLNGTVLLTTTLSPEAVLAALEQLEAEAGRAREVRWDARTLDLDILLYDDLCLRTSRLMIPHPRMAFRRFVLRPAAEIAAEMVHPEIGWTMEQLLMHLETAAEYVAIAGPVASGKTWLAQEIVAQLPGYFLSDSLDEARLADFHADSVGKAWELEFALLHERQQLLSHAHLSAVTDHDLAALMVSDFWFDQGLAHAAVRLDEEQFADYLRAFNIARQSVVPPKLLLVLERDEAAESPDKRLHEGLQALTRKPGLGPVLRLSAADPATAVTEAVAAIDAMR